MAVKILLALLALHPSLDPLPHASQRVRQLAACVRSHEDPSGALVDGDVSSGHEGLYQFALWIWNYGRSFVAGEPATPNEASRAQQDRMFYFFYVRNDGLRPEWQEC